MSLSPAEKTVMLARKRAPMTIKRQANAPKPRPRFQAWTVSQLLETYRDPRAVLLEIASTDTIKLAEQIGCTKAEALAERRLCAQAVLPYVAQKLPVQVDMRHTRAIHLNIIEPGAEMPSGHTLAPDKYEVLSELAAEPHAPPKDTDEPPLQLLTGVTVTESAIEHDPADRRETDVRPSVVASIPGESEPTS